MNRVMTFTLGAVVLAGGISWLGMELASPGYHEGSPSPNGSQVTAENIVATPSRNGHSKEANNSEPWPRLEKQLQQLQQQLHTQQQTLRQQQDEIAQLTHALAMGKPSDTEDTKDSNAPEQSEEERVRIRFEQLDGEFAQQKNDPEWSLEAATQIVNTVEKVLKDRDGPAMKRTSLVDAQCHATLCRIELATENMTALNHFSQNLVLQLGWQASMNQTVAEEPDGSVRSIMYVSRDGHELPAEEGG